MHFLYRASQRSDLNLQILSSNLLIMGIVWSDWSGTAVRDGQGCSTFTTSLAKIQHAAPTGPSHLGRGCSSTVGERERDSSGQGQAAHRSVPSYMNHSDTRLQLMYIFSLSTYLLIIFSISLLIVRSKDYCVLSTTPRLLSDRHISGKYSLLQKWNQGIFNFFP